MPGELRFANEGLSHDDHYWYLTNKHFIYKSSASPMKVVQSNYKAIPVELTDMGYFHIGDIEVLDGVLYGGIEGGDRGVLAKWNTSTLELISYVFIDEQGGVPWVTVNPADRLLYTSTWSNTEVVNVFDIETFAFVRSITIANPDVYPREIQGASFYNGYMYVATNIKDAVFRLDITTGVAEFVLQDDDNYVIDGYYYEMEGLTFWDLYDTGHGVMHMYGNFMNAREKAIHSYEDLPSRLT